MLDGVSPSVPVSILLARENITSVPSVGDWQCEL